ncbi:hypothetical protein BDD12DRAFT_849055 [Trichophaea hybrida]|nr:hypothetical protein BDD12DRAFT_849055 [Trichophaea hybrida]
MREQQLQFLRALSAKNVLLLITYLLFGQMGNTAHIEQDMRAVRRCATLHAVPA